MKKFNEFLNFAKLHIIFIYSSIFYYFVIMILMMIFNDNLWLNIKCAIFISLLMSLIWTLLLKEIRKSELFWKDANTLDKELTECETINDLISLYHKDFYNLSKAATNYHQLSELKRLKSIITTKIHYIKH